jgi:hypothetical protein
MREETFDLQYTAALRSAKGALKSAHSDTYLVLQPAAFSQWAMVCGVLVDSEVLRLC